MNMENNIMIALFMGATKRKTYFFFDISTGCTCPVYDWPMYNFDQLLYDKSFDWLMPVIQKIWDRGYSFNIQPDAIRVIDFNPETKDHKDYKGGKLISFYSLMNNPSTLINYTYKAVVETILTINNLKI